MAEQHAGVLPTIPQHRLCGLQQLQHSSCCKQHSKDENYLHGLHACHCYVSPFPLNSSSCRQQVQVYAMLGRNVEPQRPCHHLTKEGLEGCSCNPVVTVTLPISPSC